jgi:hypothetical protein
VLHGLGLVAVCHASDLYSYWSICVCQSPHTHFTSIDILEELSDAGFIYDHFFKGQRPITLAVKFERICRNGINDKRFMSGMGTDYVTNVVMTSQTTESKPVLMKIFQVKLGGLLMTKP